MNDALLLRQATVQETQLELIRRTQFNAFDGEQAVQLARIIEEEALGGEQPIVYDNQQETDSALGTGRQEYGLLSIWWD
jgi:hypothetical protein